MAKNKTPRIYSESGGDGETTYLLLHGLGATGDVWQGIREHIEANNLGRWIIPDMRGHGRSDWAETYGLGEHSTDIAELVRGLERIVIVGHSMGGLIGLSMATGWFGLNIVGIIAIGTMINWNDSDTERMETLANKPIWWFETREKALERYLKVSGLFGLLEPDSPQAASGIVEENGQFRLAADNAAGTIGGPWMSMIMSVVRCPVILATGEKDPIVSTEQYLPYDKNAIALPDAGHNSHVENPAAVWELVKKLEAQL